MICQYFLFIFFEKDKISYKIFFKPNSLSVFLNNLFNISNGSSNTIVGFSIPLLLTLPHLAYAKSIPAFIQT